MATKKRRKDVWEKSNGFCWYCSSKLNPEDWHIDHFIPKALSHQQGYDHIQDGLVNMVPSCPPCNFLKSSLYIEQFRDLIASQVTKCKKYSTHFRTAKRYRQITETPSPIVFYFERRGL